MVIIENLISGKTRYGICVNFYRPIEKPGTSINAGAQRGDRSSMFRRESWRKSVEKSSDSAFSRYVMLKMCKIENMEIETHVLF